MYRKKWYDLRKVDDGFELEPAPTERTRCFTTVNFTHAAFNCNGEDFVATDTAGCLYYIELSNGAPSYQKLGNIGRVTFVAYNPISNYELLVGLTTADIKIVKLSTNLSQICLLIAHKVPPNLVSFYKKYCLTCSCKEVIIWSLESYTKIQQLYINRNNVAIKKARFSNLGYIAVLYCNDNFQIWNFNQLEKDIKIDMKIFGIRNVKDFVFTQNGRAMIVASSQNKFVILNTCNWTLMKAINLPGNYNEVNHMSLVPLPLDGGSNHIVAWISQTCKLHFFDLNQSCFINTLYPIKPVKKLIVSPTGRYLIYIEKEGRLKLFTMERILEEKCKLSQKLKELPRVIAHGANDHLQFIRKCIKRELRSERLLTILKEFGEYPEKYRILIWSTILKLPANKTAYNALANKAAAVNFTSTMLKEYQLADRSKMLLLKTTLHCLIQWCPLLTQCTFLSNLIFPFLMIFQKDPLLGFEAILSLLLNYCQKWFEYHPLPPLNVLGIIENILLQADPGLLNVFCERGITSSEYAWPLLKTAMSEVLSGPEWLILWDHLVSFEKPLLFLMCVVAYSICSREVIMTSLKLKENIKHYFVHQGHIRGQEILKVAQQLYKNVPLRIHPSQWLRSGMITLPVKGPYPSLLTEDFPIFFHDQSPILEIEKLKEQERVMRERNRKDMEIAEAKRLKHEANIFMDRIHGMRLNVVQRCLKEQLSNANWKLRSVEERSELLDAERNFQQFRNVPRLNIGIASNEDNLHLRKSKHYEQLQQSTEKLEYEVQSFLSSCKSHKSRELTS